VSAGGGPRSGWGSTAGGAEGPFPRPRRSLGQNFLVDPNLQRRIVEEAGIEPGDTVLEIGPGRGALTGGLAERAGHLILVELDRELASRLEERFAGDERVEVVRDDILAHPLSALTPEPERLRVVGNIPYNLTTPILFHLLELPRPRSIVLMVQREVADRIMADPGSKAYGALSVGVRAVAAVEQVLAVPRTVFRPQPRVDSAVLRIDPFAPSPLTPDEEHALRTLTRALFQWRRKQLGRILRDHPDLRLDPEHLNEVLEAAGADRADRAETISPEGFTAMAACLAAGGSGPGRASPEKT
jgi:16S rRNA (adenine1518-N6/adenine1519-N6)-dimethyltransferase